MMIRMMKVQNDNYDVIMRLGDDDRMSLYHCPIDHATDLIRSEHRCINLHFSFEQSFNNHVNIHYLFAACARDQG